MGPGAFGLRRGGQWSDRTVSSRTEQEWTWIRSKGCTYRYREDERELLGGDTVLVPDGLVRRLAREAVA
ncbi:hypothetical protein [Crossiella cryophila]|uniref:Uncharacterized protein n=1 Tax=Crossiella cryophila TaxID=43355 RepID=A0A7W7FX56_9PSEU|nr:hypothetical protein [Crossiella cryophila]MBB4680273.1 hypothetical protein [Crossiella cryophila]